nr:hypothetical protein [Comamonas thiooxydans]
MTDKNPLAHYSGLLSEAAQAAQPAMTAALFAARGALQHLREGGKPTESLLNEAIAAIDSVALPQTAPDKRTDLVPGVMRCAKCEFQLVRQILAVNLGEVFAGDSKTEPCPNGCGPLWPVTWKQYAEQAMDAAETMADRAFAAEREVKQLRGEANAPQAMPTTGSVSNATCHPAQFDAGISGNKTPQAAQQGFSVSNSGTPQAAPAAVAVPDERDAFESKFPMPADCVRCGTGYAPTSYNGWRANDHVSRWEGWQARAALAATPAAAPVPDWESAAEKIAIEVAQNCGTVPNLTHPYIYLGLKALFAGAPAAAAPVVLPDPAATIYTMEALVPGGTVKHHAEVHKALPAGTKLFAEPEVRALLAGVSAPAAKAEKKLPQSEGADYFVILDQKAGTVEFAYTADLGRAFGHDHIKDAQERDSTTAHRWVVRPAYASPQAHDDKAARMKVAAALDCEGVNFAWSYLTEAIKELVKAERELVQLKSQAQADARDALAWLEELTCDLRCVSTSEDDYAWNVIEHHMAEPRERVIGWGQTAIAAVRDAQAAQQTQGGE